VQYLDQPFSGTDMSALLFACLTALYGLVWWKDRERGTLWLAGCYALGALYQAADRLHRPTGPYPTSFFWIWVGCVSVICFVMGLVNYLRPSVRVPRLGVVALLVPLLLVMLIAVACPTVTRSQLTVLTSLTIVGLAGMCLWADRMERGHGHRWVALGLIAMPGMVFIAAQLGETVVRARYWGTPPMAILGFSLLATSLFRRRKALEQEVVRRTQAEIALKRLNASLEEQVAVRTRDLQNVVTGLETFSTSVSNDLRAPLGGISGLARQARQALEQGDLASVRGGLVQIGQRVQTSSQLVTSLLSLAQVQDAPLNVQTFDLGALVDELVPTLLSAGPPAGPQPVITTRSMPLVSTDRGLVRTILMNLLGNALKFARPGRAPQIEVGGFSSAQDVTVYVRDDGVGFDLAAARDLFQPFTRQHGDAFEGHGLGLSVVRRAVERLGGKVWIESAPGEGTSVYVTLPLLKAA
jgi:signal transduction histidine kinase